MFNETASILNVSTPCAIVPPQGELVPTPVEAAGKAAHQVQHERQKAGKLAAKLHKLGINTR